MSKTDTYSIYVEYTTYMSYTMDKKTLSADENEALIQIGHEFIIESKRFV